jgi:hypothetical protein
VCRGAARGSETKGEAVKVYLAISFLFGASLSIFVASKIALATEQRIDWGKVAGPTEFKLPDTKPTDALIVVRDKSKEVARIQYNGRIFLKGKEIHTDAEYRAAMMKIMNGMAGCKP